MTVDECPVFAMIENLLKNATDFCTVTGTTIIKNPALGHGTDGSVWQTRSKTAVKAFFRQDNYQNELECYTRLKNRKISEIDGLAVPILEGFDDRLLVVQMTIVQPPYLLDFGKVYIDKKPPYYYDKQLLRNWHCDLRELFGENTDKVHEILYQLQELGIHYVDPKPANIHFGR